MSVSNSRRGLAVFLVAVSPVLVGCGSLVTAAKSPLSVQPAGMARLHFSLDQGYPSGEAYITVGTKLLGFLTNGEHFVTDLAEGEHLLILQSAQDEAIRGYFEAGKSYYVRLFSTPGIGGVTMYRLPQGMGTRVYWTPLKNWGEDLKAAHEMIKETDRVELIPAKAAEWEAEEKEDLEERLHSFRSGQDKIGFVMGPEHAF
jgi:hypothetical protein